MLSSSSVMSGQYQDSEFDSEEEDLEFHMYQQLYFEPNTDETGADTISKSLTQGQHDEKSVFETCDEQFVQLNQVHDPNHMSKRKSLTPSLTLSTTASKIHEDQNHQIDNCIYVDTLDGAELTLTDFTAKRNTKNTQNCPITERTVVHCKNCHEVSFSGDISLMKRNKVPLQSVRERLTSTCSESSIPGSVPLDVLYCNLVTSDEEEDDVIKNRLIMKNIETNDHDSNKEKANTKSNKRKRRKTLCSDDEAEDSRCNNLISVASKNALSKDDVHQLGEDSNSDEDLYILPPPKPSNPEILTLESSSDEVVLENRDGTCVKTKNNKCRKIEKPLSSILTTKKKEEKSKRIHQTSRSRVNQDRKGGESESESDSNDVDLSEASKGTDLTLNINKSLSGWVKTITKDPATIKKKVAKKPNKSSSSSVDFTKGRPNVNRMPSCEKWSLSMAHFYDSDVSDDIDVSEIHLQQSDSPADWHLIGSDYQISQRRRYYNTPERCKLCKQDGHTSNKCPRVPVCHLCSKTDHSSRSDCPENCCFKCGGEPHYYCHTTTKALTCSLCGFPGHLENICPDLWRRFHLTTHGMAVQASTEHTTKPSWKQYCYNCGKQGHYGHECPIKFQNRSYAQVPQSVFSYCCPVNLENGYFVVNVDGVQSAPPETNRTTMPINSKDAGRIIGKKGAVVKTLSKESGAQIHVVQEGQPQVLLFGPSEARLKAQEMIKVLIGNKHDGCVDFVGQLNNNNCPMPTTSGMTTLATGNSYIGKNNSWYEQFLAHLDRRKDNVEREMRAMLKRLSPKKMVNLDDSIKILKKFKLKRKCMPSTKPTKLEKTHLSVLAMNVLGRKYGYGFEIHAKIISLLKQVESCHSSIVPENICVQIAKTLEHFKEPSIKKLDKLLQYAKRYAHIYYKGKGTKPNKNPKKKATKRKSAEKFNTELKTNRIPNKNKNMIVMPNENGKKINIKKMKANKKKKAKKDKKAKERQEWMCQRS